MKNLPSNIPPSLLNKESTTLYLKLLLKQQEIEHERVKAESKVLVINANLKLVSSMRQTIVEYAQASSGNKYSPMAVSNIASIFAAISGGDSTVKSLDLSQFEDETEKTTTSPAIVNLTDMPERVKIAKTQGFRWNDHDVMPANPTIAHKRIKEWEDQIALGRASEVTHKPYDKLLKETSKAFVTGLCMALEEAHGFDQPASPYLKKRYVKLQTLALKNQGIKVVDTSREEEPPQPIRKKCTLSPEEIVEGMYQSLYEGVSIDVHHDNVTSTWKRIAEENYEGDFRKIPGLTLAKSATLGGIPTSIVWESDEERKRTIYRRRFTTEQREKYADQFKSAAEKYLDSIGY